MTGALAIPEGLDVMAQWVPCIAAGDVDALTEKALSLDAQIMILPKTIEAIGRFALLRDPTGALFGFLEPAR
ncbi:MAG: hypothetical protein ABJP02_02685 [Parasphingorhabdus sp.]|uniref:VOC family protein n=1 Tax=Parasphingorhabdus sp. TaxID=2709688 RepID=UPI0032975FD6